jgi:hypothetical protein
VTPIERAQKYKAALVTTRQSSDHLRLLTEYAKEMRSHPYSVDQICDHLAVALRTGDPTLVAIVLIAAECRPDRCYVDVLCDILHDDGMSKSHYNVCGLLGELRAPNAVACLRGAIAKVQDWDKELEIPKCALGSLAEIDTPEARNIIESTFQTGHPLLREVASELLSYK